MISWVRNSVCMTLHAAEAFLPYLPHQDCLYEAKPHPAKFQDFQNSNVSRTNIDSESYGEEILKMQHLKIMQDQLEASRSFRISRGLPPSPYSLSQA